MGEIMLFINKELSDFAKVNFTAQKGYIGVYKVGTSAYNPKDSNDFDVLIIGDQSYPFQYISDINYLKERIFANDAMSGSFDATEDKIKTLINNFATNLSEVTKINVSAQYAMGPTKAEFGNMPVNSQNSYFIHICGPMSLHDFQYFFDLFPFHALAFLAANLPILGPSLNEIFSFSSPSIVEYKNWQLSNYNRLKNCNSAKKKLKVCKIILLTKYLFNRTDYPYQKTYETLNEFAAKNIDIDVMVNAAFEYAMKE